MWQSGPLGPRQTSVVLLGLYPQGSFHNSILLLPMHRRRQTWQAARGECAIRSAGMIWHIARTAGYPLSAARNSQPGSRCSPPDPGLSFQSNLSNLLTT